MRLSKKEEAKKHLSNLIWDLINKFHWCRPATSRTILRILEFAEKNPTQTYEIACLIWLCSGEEVNELKNEDIKEIENKILEAIK